MKKVYFTDMENFKAAIRDIELEPFVRTIEEIAEEYFEWVKIDFNSDAIILIEDEDDDTAIMFTSPKELVDYIAYEDYVTLPLEKDMVWE